MFARSAAVHPGRIDQDLRPLNQLRGKRSIGDGSNGNVTKPFDVAIGTITYGSFSLNQLRGKRSIGDGSNGNVKWLGDVGPIACPNQPPRTKLQFLTAHPNVYAVAFQKI